MMIATALLLRRSAARAAFVSVLATSASALATEYHVATTGNDGAAGTAAAPFRTIQKAADVMQAGDICTVHAGLYREWVKPPRGGTSATNRIVYRAASGEAVYVSGAERITTWTQEGSVWKAVLPNTTFGAVNPYSAKITGDYLVYGGDKHQGAVYLNGELYVEKLTEAEVTGTPGQWRALVDASNTTIWANFGAKNPNTETAEITVRKYVFAPTAVGLGYITLEGFHILQAATNWAPPLAMPQEGMVMTNHGLGWIIQNNELSDSRAVCLAVGVGTANHSSDPSKTGNHLIRNNLFRRCGQGGIVGNAGAPVSIIERNLIEEVNPLTDFGGWENAGIKLHQAVDVVIRNNVIRKVHAGGAAGYGIWLDWQNQGNRVTGNVIYQTDWSTIQLEMNHGPNLIDNNILIGSGISDVSDNTIYVHNLITQSGLGVSGGDGRTPGWYTPHTFTRVGTGTLMTIDNKYFNNIYAGGGVGGLQQKSGFASDYGVYYGGASKTSWGDAHSIVAGFSADVSVTSLPNGATVSFKTDSAPVDVACPLITRDFIGASAVTKQGIENHDGSPITVDRDLLGNARNTTHPVAGPLESPAGNQTVTLLAGPTAPLPGTGGSGGGTGGSPGTGGAGTGGAGGGTGGTGGGGAGGADGGVDAGAKGGMGGTPDAGPKGGAGGTGGIAGTGGASGTGGATATGGTGGTGGTSGTGGVVGTGGQGVSGTGGAGTGGFSGETGGAPGGGGRRSGASDRGCSFSPGRRGQGDLLAVIALLFLARARRRRS
jgi:hypothetical protein